MLLNNNFPMGPLIEVVIFTHDCDANVTSVIDRTKGRIIIFHYECNQEALSIGHIKASFTTLLQICNYPHYYM